MDITADAFTSSKIYSNLLLQVCDELRRTIGTKLEVIHVHNSTVTSIVYKTYKEYLVTLIPQVYNRNSQFFLSTFIANSTCCYKATHITRIMELVQLTTFASNIHCAQPSALKFCSRLASRWNSWTTMMMMMMILCFITDCNKRRLAVAVNSISVNWSCWKHKEDANRPRCHTVCML